ncbi:von willebrand factor type A domain protein (macronuclear) [Tetrahymena thermophila SB210]|uniref:von willebrand factor type A domain protein n=1 Tax=Tetrahymena thermophila (strain SB210) TaxID=312017 RepID=Q22W46_TETTS|nr:von willebrand factor type A domain protein [Tetrahymena thermophila SB210]EAR89571.2 von willebrand factor type A domain protein [Tetrahymena thermophila SB210]|eukprot:XP_001009816.2 von willebrand factor type A domain protein [Tetrahymena thermophila SB210]
MVINKRILLLACPIFIVIAICLSAVGYSSFKSLPDLQQFIQQGHIQQQLGSKSRDIQFLDFSLEAGYQENFKQVFALRSYYYQILENNVTPKNPDISQIQALYVSLLQDQDPNFQQNNQSIYNKINNASLQEILQVTGWDNLQETVFDNASKKYSAQYSTLAKDVLLFGVLMKGILAPYYLQQQLQDTSDGSSYDLIYTVGITYPGLNFTVFLPLPNSTQLTNINQPVQTTKSNSCPSMLTGKYNFNNVCTGQDASLYVIKDSYQNYQGAGGISQKFKVNDNVDAIIYAQFQLQQKQSALKQSLINKDYGDLFLILDDDELTLLAFDDTTHQMDQSFSQNLVLQIFGQNPNPNEVNEFQQNFYQVKNGIKDSKLKNQNEKYSDPPQQFSYKVNGKVYYIIFTPIEVYPGQMGSDGQLVINYAEILFYLGYIVSESDLIQGFQETNDRLNYIELVSFIVISVISFISICIVGRYSYMISYSFQNPIITMSRLMSEIDPEQIDQEDQYESYQNYFTSDEIKSLFEAMVTLLKNFKYSNQRFHDDDALTLLELSRAKQFYIKFGNQNGVGICCNNIGNIHLKNNRYLEAISEYQEAILMATMEYNITKEEMDKENIEYRKKPQQIIDVINQNSPNRSQRMNGKKKKTFLAGSNQNPSSPLKKPNMLSSQASSMKQQKRNSKDGTVMKPSHFQNDEDIQEDDGDIENSQIAKKRMPEQFNQDNTNDNTIYRKKKDDLLMKYDLSKTRLLNRKYQLGVALFEYSTQQKDDLYHEAIRVFEKCISLSDSADPRDFDDDLGYRRPSNTTIIRKILILTKKSYCHLRLGEYKRAELHIQEAQQLYEELLLVLQEEDFHEENTSLFLNIFAQIPPEILLSKIKLQQAILELAKFNFRKAADILTRIIEEGQVYDSQIRKYAMMLLKNIMEKFNLEIPTLIPKLQKFNLRIIELIMLIDYSKDMTVDQIKYSHARCRSIFDKIDKKDKIGFVQFNELVHENFPLQEKELYNDLLEKKIRSIPMSTGGKSNLYKALDVTTGLFDKCQQMNNIEDNQKKSTLDQENNERLRFICLFTEGNNQIKEDQLEAIKEKMKKKQVNLIIINICNQNANMLYLRYLAKEISELGQFFQQGDDDVEEYLNKQREKQIKRQLICEYF